MKTGSSWQQAKLLSVQIKKEFPELSLQGVFVIPPKELNSVSHIEQRASLLKDIRNKTNSIGNRQLSLGMSADFEAAISFGADTLRIGTAIFGARK